MKEFLSEHLDFNRQLDFFDGELLKTTFSAATECVCRTIGPDAFRPHSRQINAAVLDSVLVGIARRLDQGPISEEDTIRPAYESLVELEEYKSATERATADEASVRSRLDLAISHFNHVK